MASPCRGRCRVSTKPASQCKCRCGGRFHGSAAGGVIAVKPLPRRRRAPRIGSQLPMFGELDELRGPTKAQRAAWLEAERHGAKRESA